MSFVEKLSKTGVHKYKRTTNKFNEERTLC